MLYVPLTGSKKQIKYQVLRALHFNTIETCRSIYYREFEEEPPLTFVPDTFLSRLILKAK